MTTIALATGCPMAACRERVLFCNFGSCAESMRCKVEMNLNRLLASMIGKGPGMRIDSASVRRQAALCFVIVLAAIASAGCGEAVKAVKHPDLVPLSGVVTYQGKPLAEATVQLHSDETTKKLWVPSAITDSSGRFTIRTRFTGNQEEAGVIPGTYKATVAKRSSAKSPAPAEQPADTASAKGSGDKGKKKKAAGPPAPALKQADFAVPVRYILPTTTPLEVNAAKAGTSAELKLE